MTFPCAPTAWFWATAQLAARRDGTSCAAPQPCVPDDIVKALDWLYRRRRIDLVHARVLRIWGERQVAPDPAKPSERSDWRLWTEAMGRLDWVLRQRGIVG